MPLIYTAAFDFDASGEAWVSKEEELVTVGYYPGFGVTPSPVKVVNGNYGRIDKYGNTLLPFTVDFHHLAPIGSGLYFCEYWSAYCGYYSGASNFWHDGFIIYKNGDLVTKKNSI